jgi:hypothetical protein
MFAFAPISDLGRIVCESRWCGPRSQARLVRSFSRLMYALFTSAELQPTAFLGGLTHALVLCPNKKDGL